MIRDTLHAEPALQIVFRQEIGGVSTIKVDNHSENYIVQVGFLNVVGERPLRHHIAIRDLKHFVMSTELIVGKDPFVKGMPKTFC